jgi:hypothetical protein
LTIETYRPSSSAAPITHSFRKWGEWTHIGNIDIEKCKIWSKNRWSSSHRFPPWMNPVDTQTRTDRFGWEDSSKTGLKFEDGVQSLFLKFESVRKQRTDVQKS